MNMLLQVLTRGDSAVLIKLDTLSKSIAPQSDTAVTSKLDSLSKSVAILIDKAPSSITQWLPLIAALIAAGALLYSQHLERSKKRVNELKDKALDTFIKSELLYVQLKSLCRRLSSEQNKKEFWFFIMRLRNLK